MKKVTLAVFFLTIAAFCMPKDVAAQAVNSRGDARVVMQTTEGSMTIVLYGDTPRHRDNFLKLVAENFYDSILFHRVIRGFMVQAGDPASRNAKPGQFLGNGSLNYTIPAEFHHHLFHKRGALCAARQGDNVNPMKESSSTQFYIVQGRVWSDRELRDLESRTGMHYSGEQLEAYRNEGGAPFLDGSYTVFGQVVDGLEVIDRIAGYQTDRNDRPKNDVRILSIRVIK